jgi:carbonic anhydrase
MQLFEAVVDANRRRVAGDKTASVPVADFSAALPVAALTCIDARLNHLLPEMLGIPEEHFIWLRNAGNIITSPLSSTMRSLAMACAIKGGKEIAIIGHSDCLVGKTTAMQLLDRLAALGVDRKRLPENLVEYFGLFGTERQNVMKAVDFVRASPLIGAKVPVHGLMIDLKSGQLEWIVNGYQNFQTAAAPATSRAGQMLQQADDTLKTLGQIGNIAVGDIKFPETKIGEFVKTAQDWVHKAEQATAVIEEKLGQKAAAAKPAAHSLPPPLPQTLADKLRLASRRSPK